MLGTNFPLLLPLAGFLFLPVSSTPRVRVPLAAYAARMSQRMPDLALFSRHLGSNKLMRMCSAILDAGTNSPEERGGQGRAERQKRAKERARNRERNARALRRPALPVSGDTSIASVSADWLAEAALGACFALGSYSLHFKSGGQANTAFVTHSNPGGQCGWAAQRT
jgi:hypothetical protein